MRITPAPPIFGIYLLNIIVVMSVLTGIKLTIIIIVCSVSGGLFPIHMLAAEAAAQNALPEIARYYLKDAVNWYKQAIWAEPDWPLPYIQVMRLDLIRQDCPSALDVKNAALKVLPRIGSVWLEAADVAEKCGRPAEQLEDLRNAYHFEPTAQNAAALTYAYLTAGLPVLALRQGLAAQQVNDAGKLYIGIAALHVGRFQIARKIFNEIADGAGITWFAQYQQLALQWQNSPKDMFQLGMLDLSAQFPLLAAAAFTTAQKNGYTGAELAENIAWAYWIAGNSKYAQIALAAADPHSAKTVGLRAAIALASGQAGLAETMLQSWLHQSGQAPAAIWLLLAQASMQNHMYSVAEQAYWSLLRQTDPANQYQYLVLLCHFYIQSGLGKSEPLAQTAFYLLQHEKKLDSAGAAALAEWLVWQGSAPAAEILLTHSIAMYPQDVSLRCAAAIFYTSIGNLDLAKAQYALADQLSLYGCS